MTHNLFIWTSFFSRI